jgi:hypothetical protein
MSTSRYSKPDIKLDFSAIQPNTRRWTSVKLVTIAALLMIDLLALIGSTSLVESLGLVILVLVNLWAINCAR